MEQFVLIPQQLYEQKFKLNVYKLDKSEEKVNFVPQNLDSPHKDIITNTKSFKNESVVDQILKCPRIKLSLSDSILRVFMSDAGPHFQNFSTILFEFKLS